MSRASLVSSASSICSTRFIARSWLRLPLSGGSGTDCDASDALDALDDAEAAEAEDALDADCECACVEPTPSAPDAADEPDEMWCSADEPESAAANA
jgi:hypothetical protein